MESLPPGPNLLARSPARSLTVPQLMFLPLSRAGWVVVTRRAQSCCPPCPSAHQPHAAKRRGEQGEPRQAARSLGSGQNMELLGKRERTCLVRSSLTKSKSALGNLPKRSPLRPPSATMPGPSGLFSDKAGLSGLFTDKGEAAGPVTQDPLCGGKNRLHTTRSPNTRDGWQKQTQEPGGLLENKNNYPECV